MQEVLKFCCCYYFELIWKPESNDNHLIKSTEVEGNLFDTQVRIPMRTPLNFLNMFSKANCCRTLKTVNNQLVGIET